MGDVVGLRAFAKVNYVLSVLGLRDDGYHEVATVMQSISLADEVEIEKTDSGFGIFVEPERVDVGPQEKNTVYKAWSLLREIAGEELPAKVRLYKKIPSGAGLGGASADAAAVLVGLNEMFGLGLKVEELREVGGRIGADVPFCITGGTALGEGIGGRLTPLPAPPDHRLLLLKPERGAETALIYRAYDEHPEHPASVEPMLRALEAGDLGAMAKSADNNLSRTTKSLVPEVAEYEKALLKNGALGACMSGTGTAVYGIFDTEEAFREAANASGALFSGVYEPVLRGVEVL